MKSLPSLDGLDAKGHRVLVRSDLNVPLVGGEVADDHRLAASLETILALREAGAAVVVCSHLGRPRGFDASLRMDPVAARLGELGGFGVVKIDGVIGPDVEDALQDVPDGHVAVLENTRFEAGETANDPALGEGLARLADRFVLDAFGSAHRAHASTVGVSERLPSAAGLLLRREVEVLSRLLDDPEQPYVVVLGGAKISDKLPVLENLLPLVDLMLVGGGMCFTLLAAGGYEVGSSLVEEDMVDEVRKLLASDQGGKILLPADVIAADGFEAEAPHRTVAATAIPAGTIGLDVGPETVSRFGSVVESAATVFWNGPMGVFEWDAFRSGTTGLAQAMARGRGYTVVGGGDSVAALRYLGLDSDVSHVSTGGGAGLEVLQGRPLPGIEALRRWAHA